MRALSGAHWVNKDYRDLGQSRFSRKLYKAPGGGFEGGNE